MKKVLGALLFIALLVTSYLYVNSVLHIKTEDGVTPMRVYHELPKDTVDVLMVGSSHIGMNVDTATLFDEYGIAGFRLWSGMQPVWNGYYFVKEGLAVQNPKLVVLEAFTCCHALEYSDQLVALKSVQSTSNVIDRLQEALVSYPTWQRAVEASWGLPDYHNRYNELAKEDFTFYTETPDLGAEQLTLSNIHTVYPLDFPDYASITDEEPITEKDDEYLRKTIRLCRAKGVKVLVLISPFLATETESERINTLERIAREEGADFLNYLKIYPDADIDPQTDFYDIGHLNWNGVQKYSRSLGAYIRASYELPDRRTDENHLWAGGTRHIGGLPPTYALTQQFMGDGVVRCIDTDIKLYENRFAEWTILTRLDTRTYDDEGIYFSCFSEVAEQGYYGLMIKKKDDGVLSVRLGPNHEEEVRYTGDTVDLAIVKEQELYTLYANGTPIISKLELSCPSYTGTLLLGCQELSPGGERFRYSRTGILNFELYQDRAMDASQVAAWEPETLPPAPMAMGQGTDDVELVWQMDQQFMGDNGAYIQDRFIDSNLCLYDDPATRFTLTARVLPGTLGNDNVYFSCFSETENNYRGLMLRQVVPDSLDLLVGQSFYVPIPCTPGEPLDLVITKDVSLYSVYVNGELIADGIDSPCQPYAGTLLVGCQINALDEYFRFSATRVQSLSVYSGVAAPGDCLIEDAPLPEMRVATSVNYALGDPFLGDGKSRYLDAGIILYDVPKKDWTLSTDLVLDKAALGGVFLSCIDGSGAGFMAYKEAESSLTLRLGRESRKLSFETDDMKIRLVVVKSGDTYVAYGNGAELARVESAVPAHNRHLIAGAQQTESGELSRFSNIKVEALTVADGAIDEAAARAQSVYVEKAGRF